MVQKSRLTPVFCRAEQANTRAPSEPWSIRKIGLFASVLEPDRINADFAMIGKDELCLAHDPQYVDSVLELRSTNGFGTTCADINNAVLWSNSSFVAAARHALKHGGVVCSASQGFHHAGHDFGGQYCTFNGLIVAANSVCSGRRVLIIDGDAHYGNGTDDCIRRLRLDSRVFNITRGTELGRPIQSSWRKHMWYAWTRDLMEVYEPDIIFYQAGADAWIDDPYGCGYLSSDGLRHRDTGVLKAGFDAMIPVVWNLAGGYSDRAVNLHHQTLRVSDEVLQCQDR